MLRARRSIVEERQPEQAPGTPVFDRAALRDRVDGDEQLMVDVINIFLEDCPSQLGAIQRAIESKDPAAIRATAHALTGAAANLGASRLSDAAGALERVGAESRLNAADAAWRRLAAEAAAVLHILKTEIASAEP